MNNSIYIHRRNKILLPSAEGSTLLPLNYVATVNKNLESLGYVFSESLNEACRHLSEAQFVDLYQELMPLLRRLKGAHRVHKPMYVNFPEEVMALSECELYFNAIIHYISGGTLLPAREKKERFPLIDNYNLQVLDLGSIEDFEGLFTQLASSNTSLSVQDQEDLTWYISTYGNDIKRILPEAVPQKENMAFLAQALMSHTDHADEFLAKFCSTATDVLRLAVGMSSGDVSLAKASKFRKFSRKERTLFLKILEKKPTLTEDMLRWKERWKKLGHNLHVGEYQTKYPKTYQSFNILRNDLSFETFNSKLEKLLVSKDTVDAATKLSSRPGDFARRLDHLIRLSPVVKQNEIVTEFSNVASKVSTPVLLQVMQHFKMRNNQEKLRVFFPKGSLAKAQAIENTLPSIPAKVCGAIASVCEKTLIERFKSLPSLGKVYIGEELENFNVPFGMRSSSKAMRTLVRGSRLPIDSDASTIRFFIWWKNIEGDDYSNRVDIDLSAALFDEDFNYVDAIAYYNLKTDEGCHSGDITNAPDGASEFIDINLSAMASRGRYVVMTINSYTCQTFSTMPECFAGFMTRQSVNSGEIYEPRTVQNRIDVTGDSKISIPLVIDVWEKKVIWCDISLKNHPSFNNNVHSNKKGIGFTLKSIVDMNKPNLHDLFTMHAKARGKIVRDSSKADSIFSLSNETPFKLEEIASSYMQ